MWGSTFLRAIMIVLPVVLAASYGSLHGGQLTTLSNSPATSGKLTLSSASIHIDGASARDVDFSNVLEANFSDDPFHLPYFASSTVQGDHLPSDWVTNVVNSATPPGSASFSGGKLTITGNGGNDERLEDTYFFTGMPWKGDGQWTAYFTESKPSPSTEVILAVRDSLKTGGTFFGAGVNANGDGTFHFGGSYAGFTEKFPLKLRFTRRGISLEISFFNNDNKWENLAVANLRTQGQIWAGIAVNSHDPKNNGSAVIEQIVFTPPPAQPETLLPGILLTSGSFLAGDTFHFSPQGGGGILRGNDQIILKPEQISAAIYQPLKWQQISAAGSQQGIILLNGDFLAGDIQSVGAATGGGMTTLSSITLGLLTYYNDKVFANVIHPVEPKSSDYEIRLHDGSIIRASSFDLNGDLMVVHEISDIPIEVNVSEIAQIRAGENKVQPLLELLGNANTSQAKKQETGPADDPVMWQGPDREQILVVPAGGKVEFPLNGKFQSVTMRMAMAPGSPPQSQVGVTVSIDGTKLPNAIKLKEGAEPLAVRIPVSSPKSLTFSVDSAPAGAGVLLVDPVAVRAGVTPHTSPDR